MQDVYGFSIMQDVAFVIDGWALEIALKHYKKAFSELAILSRTAICCRVTPSQKAQVQFAVISYLRNCFIIIIQILNLLLVH